MKIEVIHHHYHHDDRSKEILEAQLVILRKVMSMSAALDRLTREVSETKTAIGSIKQLVGNLAEQIRALKDDPAALEALANELDAEQAGIADTVLANTPEAPPAPPAEETTPAPSE